MSVLTQANPSQRLRRFAIALGDGWETPPQGRFPAITQSTKSEPRRGEGFPNGIIFEKLKCFIY